MWGGCEKFFTQPRRDWKKKKLRFWEVVCVNDFSALPYIVCVLTYWIIKNIIEKLMNEQIK